MRPTRLNLLSTLYCFRRAIDIDIDIERCTRGGACRQHMHDVHDQSCCLVASLNRVTLLLLSLI